MNTRIGSLARSLACLGGMLVANMAAWSAPSTWTGSAKTGSISDAGNFLGNSAPPSGSALAFGQDFGTGFAGFDSGVFAAPTVTFLSGASSGFYLTAATVSDILNVTGSGTTVTNASSFRMGTQVMTLRVGGSQTWDGGAGGLSISAIDLGTGQTLTLTGTGTSAGNLNEIMVGIAGSGSSGIVKQGPGTLLFIGSNTYTGATTVSQGTLQLGASERMLDSSNLILDGGTFSTNGFDQTLGKLTLTNSSTIDFGSGGTSHLVFASSSDQNWGSFVLYIINFDPTRNTLRFGADGSGITAAQLAVNIRLNGTAPGQVDGNGFITQAAVPVPAMPRWGEPILACALIVVAARQLLNRRKTLTPE